MKKEDLIGVKFGRLTVIAPAPDVCSAGGYKKTAWLCRCECGRERVVRAAYLKRGEVMHCGKCGRPVERFEIYKPCRWCEHSTMQRGKWQCARGRNTDSAFDGCPEYCCSEKDKINGVKNRSSKCIICGKPAYGHGAETPIYCKEHRAYANRDEEVLDNMPYELLFSLIESIFEKARMDYIYNTDGYRRDAERFLKSEWAQTLSGCGYSVEKCFEALDTEMINELQGLNGDTK